jgi:hypothetical protein
MASKRDEIKLLVVELERTTAHAVKLRLRTVVYLLRMARLESQLILDNLPGK